MIFGPMAGRHLLILAPLVLALSTCSVTPSVIVRNSGDVVELVVNFDTARCAGFIPFELDTLRTRSAPYETFNGWSVPHSITSHSYSISLPRGVEVLLLPQGVNCTPVSSVTFARRDSSWSIDLGDNEMIRRLKKQGAIERVWPSGYRLLVR